MIFLPDLDRAVWCLPRTFRLPLLNILACIKCGAFILLNLQRARGPTAPAARTQFSRHVCDAERAAQRRRAHMVALRTRGGRLFIVPPARPFRAVTGYSGRTGYAGWLPVWTLYSVRRFLVTSGRTTHLFFSGVGRTGTPGQFVRSSHRLPHHPTYRAPAYYLTTTHYLPRPLPTLPRTYPPRVAPLVLFCAVLLRSVLTD